MYLPYFRGKQAEIAALKELISVNKLSNKILPIIEPIRFKSDLVKLIKQFQDEKRHMILIHNPQVGDFKSKLSQSEEKLFEGWLTQEYIIVGHILNDNSSNELAYLKKIGVEEKRIVIIESMKTTTTIDIKKYKFCIKSSKTYQEKHDIIFNEDKFNKQPRNLDYSTNPIEIFSDEHILYAKRKDWGFSDYSIIGKEFIIGGWQPLIVVVHIIYMNCMGALEIRHFTSDINLSRYDINSKVTDVINKVCKWAESKGVRSMVLDEFKEYSISGKTTNLTILKKLGIKQHLVVVSEYFDIMRPKIKGLYDDFLEISEDARNIFEEIKSYLDSNIEKISLNKLDYFVGELCHLTEEYLKYVGENEDILKVILKQDFNLLGEINYDIICDSLCEGSKIYEYIAFDIANYEMDIAENEYNEDLEVVLEVCRAKAESKKEELYIDAKSEFEKLCALFEKNKMLLAKIINKMRVL